ncbi:MAG: TrmB family transcriptional regulator [Thaumarchaeota archaeon 13_1_40CM_38_12]|nr:MAG: TrmB family transcriptional regulator [Thaumarchaeota archaeon 13_1_40CM_38_12]OLC35991.1 MAG: TrmB family transcriptional regulator [Thaumarchaeota archaeon 13_1_40CM_4_38_7]OLC92910.1 MAG: TrmB family transcriptional regulator [Thaumarchaeota archaeon 13_1_40CM_3_38_6]OLD30451.1 MAG: TrmB family transcriptional regulator [Thaumarchaeota archaeon 13_1_40CM_2_39_7]
MPPDVTHFSILDAVPESKAYDYEMLLEKLKNELSKFGLTANQSKVYLFLEKYGPSTATQVSKTLKVPRTETYHLLTNLQNKGIVSATFQHPIRFSALSLDKAMGVLINAEKERVKNLESQEKNLVELWGTIPNFKVNQEDIKDGKFQMLQGVNQMTGKINDMVSSAKKSIQILASEKDFMKFYHSGFLEKISESNNIEPQLISSSSKKTEYIFEGRLKEAVKRLPMKIKEDLCFIIKDDDQLLLFMKSPSESPQNIIAMWTDSFSMVYTLKLLFTYIWSNSKYLR